MKRHGIINAELAGRCAALGHTDRVVVADCGLPRPAHVPLVDLALVHGVPSFRDTLAALIAELEIQDHTYALEAGQTPAEEWIADHADHLGQAYTVSHDELKTQLGDCSLMVRTGEATPFANVILTCGVPF